MGIFPARGAYTEPPIILKAEAESLLDLVLHVLWESPRRLPPCEEVLVCGSEWYLWGTGVSLSILTL